MRRFYLIGFMGSGKSFLGRRLANALQLPFLDLDDYLEEWSGRSIPRIFEESGEEAFRKLESEALRDTARLPSAVIACGGGTPCFGDNMAWMNAHGITIFLEAPAALIADRLIGETDHRPLLKGLDETQLRAAIEAKMEQRLPYYRQASVIVRQRPGEEADLVGELLQYLPDITGH